MNAHQWNKSQIKHNVSLDEYTSHNHERSIATSKCMDQIFGSKANRKEIKLGAPYRVQLEIEFDLHLLLVRLLRLLLLLCNGLDRLHLTT